ncbi:MAG TPA: hypothetical protein VGL12_01895, partial [Roseiarcus sp.]
MTLVTGPRDRAHVDAINARVTAFYERATDLWARLVWVASSFARAARMGSRRGWGEFVFDGGGSLRPGRQAADHRPESAA